MKRLILALLVLAGLALTTAPVFTQVVGTQYITAASSDCSTAGSCATFDVSSAPAVALTVSGTFSTVNIVEATADGVRWDPIQAVLTSTGSSSTAASAAGTYSITNSGFMRVRIRCSTYTSGMVKVVETLGVLPASTATATPCNILSAASTNATSCKATAGNLVGYDLFNTTTTVYYLRLYDAAAAPTCSSATGFIRSIPIPPAAAAGGVGGAISNMPVPVSFATGVGYCLTGGASSTDNTNAATGVFGELRIK